MQCFETPSRSATNVPCSITTAMLFRRQRRISISHRTGQEIQARSISKCHADFTVVLTSNTLPYAWCHTVYQFIAALSVYRLYNTFSNLLPPGSATAENLVTACPPTATATTGSSSAGTWSSGYTRCCRSGCRTRLPGAQYGSLWPGSKLPVQPVLQFQPHWLATLGSQYNS